MFISCDFNTFYLPRHTHHAHLRLATAVFSYVCEWLGLHTVVRKHLGSKEFEGGGMPEKHMVAFDIASGFSAEQEAVALLGAMLQLPILHLNPAVEGSGKSLYDESARAAVSIMKIN